MNGFWDRAQEDALLLIYIHYIYHNLLSIRCQSYLDHLVDRAAKFQSLISDSYHLPSPTDTSHVANCLQNTLQNHKSMTTSSQNSLISFFPIASALSLMIPLISDYVTLGKSEKFMFRPYSAETIIWSFVVLMFLSAEKTLERRDLHGIRHCNCSVWNNRQYLCRFEGRCAIAKGMNGALKQMGVMTEEESKQATQYCDRVFTKRHTKW